MANIVSQSGVSVGQAAEFIAALKRAGLSSVRLQRVIEDKDVARTWVRAFPQAVRGLTSEAKARELMGNHFLGEEIISKLGLGSAFGQAAKFALVPFSDEELAEAWVNGQYLVAMPDINLNTLLTLCKRWFHDPITARMLSASYAGTLTRPGYHLLHPDLRTTVGLSQPVQLLQLPPDYEVPLAVELAYFMGAMLSLGYDLNWIDRGLQCRDVDDNGHNALLYIYHRSIAVGMAPKSWNNEDFVLASGLYRGLAEE